MGTIIVEVAACTMEELEDDIEEAVVEFDKCRQRERDCLPLTDYEKTLLAQFLKSLTSTP